MEKEPLPPSNGTMEEPMPPNNGTMEEPMPPSNGTMTSWSRIKNICTTPVRLAVVVAVVAAAVVAAFISAFFLLRSIFMEIYLTPGAVCDPSPPGEEGPIPTETYVYWETILQDAKEEVLSYDDFIKFKDVVVYDPLVVKRCHHALQRCLGTDGRYSSVDNKAIVTKQLTGYKSGADIIVNVTFEEDVDCFCVTENIKEDREQDLSHLRKLLRLEESD